MKAINIISRPPYFGPFLGFFPSLLRAFCSCTSRRFLWAGQRQPAGMECEHGKDKPSHSHRHVTYRP